MRMGTRWSAGDEAPAAVPASLRAEIIAVDRAVLGATTPTPDQGGTPRWTLTWLEGRPIAELDTGVIVSIDADGTVVVRHDVDDEFG